MVRVDIPLNLSNGDSSDLSVDARPEEEYAHIERKHLQKTELFENVNSRGCS